ncbi:MAG: hypothetical protein RL722_405 [Pseudomonadota bacterium]|jgi:hypothetical protein
MPTPTIELTIKSFKPYQPDQAGGGNLPVMTSSFTGEGVDARYAVKDGGRLLSVDAKGNLVISRARGKNDEVRISVFGPDGYEYRAQGLVSQPTATNGGASSKKTPFGEFVCRKNSIDIKDAEEVDTTWEFFVLVQRVREVKVGNDRKYEFSFGLVDPRIINN